MKLVILVNTRYSREYKIFSKILSIFEKFDLIESIRLIRSSQFNQKWLPDQILKIIHFCTLFDSIESIISEMAFWPNFKLFRSKLSPNQTKNGKNPSFPPKNVCFQPKNMCPKNTISAIKLQVSRTIIAMFMAIKAMFMAIKVMCFKKLFVLMF